MYFHVISYSSRLRKKLAFSFLVVLVVYGLLLLHFEPLRFGSSSQLSKDVFISPSVFHKKVMKLFRQVKHDKDRFWKAHSELQHLDVEIPLEAILDDESPKELFYDPRLTIAVYMDELTRVGKQSKPPTLPFHWVDWMDISITQDHLGAAGMKDITCQELKNHMSGNADPAIFCRERDSLSKEEIEALGFQNVNELPRALIYDHCPHEKQSFNAVRMFMAKSFAMTYLPKPYRVIILDDGRKCGTYEFMVDQERKSELRLLYSGMTERFVLRFPKYSAQKVTVNQATETGKKIRFNPRQVFSRLQLSVLPRYLKKEEDDMNMHLTVKRSTEKTKTLEMEDKHFSYPKENIKTQIDEYAKKEHLTISERNYLDGLKECANYDGTNEPTYFKMPVLDIKEPKNIENDWGWHYDWRFFNGALMYEKDGWTKAEKVERFAIILERLLRNWNRFAEAKGIVSWIMHGPLLSWYWNGLMFPFDNDIDIQMPISELIRLSKAYNQTLVVESPSEGYGRYLIDVGTYIHNREPSDKGNYIDARFIDVDSGVYIDITGLAKSSFDVSKEKTEEIKAMVAKLQGDAQAEVYNDRRALFYTLDQLLPLQYSMLDGVPVYIPNEIEARLRLKYKNGLDDLEFRGWYFVQTLHLWVKKDKLMKAFDEGEYTNDQNHYDIEKMVARVKHMSDQDTFRLLQDDDILVEYYCTASFTDWHEHEKALMFGSKNIDRPKDAAALKKTYFDLLRRIQFSPPRRKALYEYEALDRPKRH